LDEGEVVALVEAVCRKRRRRPPHRVSFHAGPHAFVLYGKDGTLNFPRRSYIKKYHLLSSRGGHILLVLHEVTHWLVGRKAGHKPDPFYTTLYALAEEYGLDVEHAVRDELTYKPRYAATGYRLYKERRGAVR
jgi:hypothetical protein